MNERTITEDYRLNLSHLTVQQESGDEYTVGDPRIPKFVRLPGPAVHVVRLADGTRPIREIRASIAAERGWDLDVLEFAQDLEKLGLVADAGVPQDGTGASRSRMERAAERVGRTIFRSRAKWFYCGAFAAAVGLISIDPSLFPRYGDLFLLPVMGTNSLVVSLVACLLIFLHECAHLLAAYGAGVRAKIRVNLRFVFVVAETDMTGLWGKERNKRYFPYLAGMAWDTVVLLAALLAQLALPEDGFASAFARLVALLLFLGLLSQFMVFLRTDVYFVLGNLTQSADLAGSGRRFLRKLWRRDRKEAGGWESLPPKEKLASRWFGLAYAIGIATVAVQFSLFSLPATYYALQQAIGQVADSDVGGPVFWDGAILLSLAAFRLALYGKGAQTALRDKRNKRAVRQVQ